MGWYMLSAAAVWGAILASAVVLLAGSPAFDRLLPVLLAGATWFVFGVPLLVLRGWAPRRRRYPPVRL